MPGETPLVVHALVALGWCVGAVCFLLDLPFYCYYRLTKGLVCHRVFEEDSGEYIKHALMFPLRWLLATLAIPLLACQVLSVCYAVNYAMSSIIAAVLCFFATAGAMLYGLYWMKKRKLRWDNADKYFFAVLDSQLDLLAFVCVIAEMLLIVRIPFVLSLIPFRKAHLHTISVRNHIFVELLMSFVDLATFGCFMFVTLTVWRYQRIYQRLCRALAGVKFNPPNKIFYDFSYDFGIRGFIMHSAFSVLLDCVFWVMGVFVLCTTPWRWRIIIHKFARAGTLSVKRKTCWFQFGRSLLDWLCIPFGIIAFCSLYRTYTIRYFYNQTRAVERRILVLEQCWFILVDIFTILCTVVLILTVYKARLLNRNPHHLQWRSISYQGYIISLFLDFLCDLPAIFCLVIIVLTVWRLPLLLYDIFKKRNPVKQSIYHHFLMLFVDILDLPFWIMSLFVWITLWRSMVLVRALRKAHTRGDIRRAIVRQFFLLLVDVPAALCALVVFVTIWRARTLYQQLKAIYLNPDLGKAQPKSPDNDENPAPQQAYVSTKFLSLWHWVTFVQFALFIVDLPFFLLTIFILLAPWRYYMLKHILRAPMGEWDRKKLIAYQALQICLDFPAVIACALVFMSWRCLTLYRELKEASLEDNKQNMIFNQLWQLIVDIPFCICGMICFWRIPILLYRSWTEYENATERRYACLKSFALGLIDAPVFVLLLVMVLTLWRIPFLWEMYKKLERGDNWHKAICIEFLQWLIDLPFVLTGLVVLVTMWRIPCLVYEIKKDKNLWAIRWSMARMCGLVIFDIVATTAATIHICTLIRAHTFVFLVHHYYSSFPIIGDFWSEYRKTRAYYLASTRTILLLLLDLLSLLLLPFAFLTIFDGLKMLVHMVSICHIHFSAIDRKSTSLSLMYRKAYTLSSTEFGLDSFPFSMSLFRFEISRTVEATIYHIVHFLLLPLKLLGWMCVPFHKILYEVIPGPEKSFNNFCSHGLRAITDQSLLNSTWEVVDSLIPLTVATFILICGFIFILIVASLLFIPMFFLSFGAPLWEKIKLFTPPMFYGIIETVCMVVQIFSTPIFLLLCCTWMLAPTLLSSPFRTTIWDLIGRIHHDCETLSICVGTVLPSEIPTVSSIQSFMYQITPETVIIQCAWMPIVISALWSFFTISEKHAPLFQPIGCYVWLVSRIFSGKMWGMYRMILAKLTMKCFSFRRVLFLGELLMFPILAIWGAWPLFVVYKVGIRWLFFIVIPVSCFLYIQALQIVRSSWKAAPVLDPTPVCHVTKVTAQLSHRIAGHGLSFHVEGRKQADLTVKHAQLTLVGNELWDVLSATIGANIVRFARVAVLPMQLCPTYMNPHDFKNTDSHFRTEIHFGDVQSMRICHATLLSNLRRIAAAGDPNITLRVEHGEVGWRFEPLGVLFEITTSVNGILAALDTTTANHEIEFVAAPATTGLQPQPPKDNTKKGNNRTRKQKLN
ncbi:hypothetical protein Pelo_12623 [Pelomyxa schiedti]|nr:hypothetical protein Pelo_12623 [Pelomyxa schiedti]